MRSKLISLILSVVAAVPCGAALTISAHPGQANAAPDGATKKATPTKAKKTPTPKKSTKKKSTKKHKTTKKKKTVKKATPKPTAKPKSTSTPRPTATPTSDESGTVAGPQIQSRYGPIQVSLVVQNGQITDVKVSNAPDTARSVMIQNQAVPLLKQEALKAQTANIHMISGATITSRAFEQSLQGGLTKAGI